MYDIVTGMSLDYYNKIGNKMLSSFLEYWPKESSITVYTEDDLPIESDRILVVSLDHLDNGYTEFQLESNVAKLEERCKTFAKKAFPIIKHLEKDNGKLLWLDADVLTLSEINFKWLDSLISSNQFSCHFGVPQGDYYSVETGFFIINRENKYKEIFLEKYKNIYLNKDFNNMHKPFDGDVFGRVIRECISSYTDFQFNELNFNTKKSRSPLNKVFRKKFIHFKGKKKPQIKNYT